MKFEEKDKVVCCKDKYYKEYDNNRFYFRMRSTDGFSIANKELYYKGYLVDQKDGPAIKMYNTKYWYNEGKLHRADGPAIKFYGNKRWYLNGIEYSEEKYNKTILNVNNKKRVLDEI